MLSDVVIVGKIGERKGALRYIIYESKKNCYTDDEMVTSKIPCLYWTRTEVNIFNKLPKGTFVMCRGRIEYDDTLGGLYLLLENVITPK